MFLTLLKSILIEELFNNSKYYFITLCHEVARLVLCLSWVGVGGKCTLYNRLH